MEQQARVGSSYRPVTGSIYYSLALSDRKYEQEDRLLRVIDLIKADTRKLYVDAVCLSRRLTKQMAISLQASLRPHQPSTSSFLLDYVCPSFMMQLGIRLVSSEQANALHHFAMRFSVG